MERLEKCPVCGSENRDVFLELKDWFLSQQEFTIEKCRDCGFLFTNPRPFAEKLGEYYKSEEYISHSNTDKGIISRLYKIVRSFTLKQKYKVVSRHKNKGRILDIGSGTGELLNHFKLNGWQVQGIEPDIDARNFAINEYELPVEDEEHLGTLQNDSFDVVTMWHVLEHVPNLNERIQTIYRLLKDDGVLVVAVPNPASYDAVKYGKYWAAYDVPRHLYHFRKEDVEMLFEKHGFEVKNILPMRFDSFYVSMLSEKYQSGKSNLPGAFFTGLKSNNKAVKNMNYSSLIYVIRKK